MDITDVHIRSSNYSELDGNEWCVPKMKNGGQEQRKSASFSTSISQR